MPEQFSKTQFDEAQRAWKMSLQTQQFVDFYELLGEPENAAAPRLRARMAELYAEALSNRDHRNLTTRRRYSELLELLPRCRAILLDESRRAQYDNYVMQARLGTPQPDFQTFINRLVTPNQDEKSSDKNLLGVRDTRSTTNTRTSSTQSPSTQSPSTRPSTEQSPAIQLSSDNAPNVAAPNVAALNVAALNVAAPNQRTASAKNDENSQREDVQRETFASQASANVLAATVSNAAASSAASAAASAATSSTRTHAESLSSAGNGTVSHTMSEHSSELLRDATLYIALMERMAVAGGAALFFLALVVLRGAMREPLGLSFGVAALAGAAAWFGARRFLSRSKMHNAQ